MQTRIGPELLHLPDLRVDDLLDGFGREVAQTDGALTAFGDEILRRLDQAAPGPVAGFAAGVSGRRCFRRKVRRRGNQSNRTLEHKHSRGTVPRGASYVERGWRMPYRRA